MRGRKSSRQTRANALTKANKSHISKIMTIIIVIIIMKGNKQIDALTHLYKRTK